MFGMSISFNKSLIKVFMFTKGVLSVALNPTVFWVCQYDTLVSDFR